MILEGSTLEDWEIWTRRRTNRFWKRLLWLSREDDRRDAELMLEIGRIQAGDPAIRPAARYMVPCIFQPAQALAFFPMPGPLQ